MQKRILNFIIIEDNKIDNKTNKQKWNMPMWNGNLTFSE